MIILCLDISSVSTGYAVFNSELTGPLVYDVVKIPVMDHGKKLDLFERNIKSLIETYHPDRIYIEDIWVNLNIKTYKILSFYHGIVHKLCYQLLNSEPLILYPSQVRKILSDKYSVKLTATKKEKELTGLDSKQLTFNFIIDFFKLPHLDFKKDNDRTDALALGLAAKILIGDSNEGSVQNSRDRKGSKRGRGKKSLSKASS